MTQYKRHIESDYLKVFQEVTGLISSVHTPSEVMELVVQRLPELLEVDATTIRLYDEATDSFILGAANGVSEKYLSRTTIDSREVMNEIRSGRPTVKQNVNLALNQDYGALIASEGVKSTMSLPILHKGKVIGVMRLLTRQTRDFKQGEINFAMSLAEQVGMAITNSKLFEEMENQVNFLSELRKISSLVNSTLDLEEILGTIVDKLPKALGVKGCTIRLLHSATNKLELVAASGLSEKYLSRGSISREDSIFRVLKGDPVMIYDAPNDPRVNYHEDIRAEGIKSILVVPVKDNNEIIGVLRLLTDSHHAFSASEIDFAVTMAEEGGNAIEKARTYRKITLLFNQIEEHERFLQTILDSLWLGLIVVDPDKRVIMANKNFLETRSLKENEALGLLYEDVVPWQVNEDEECPVMRVFKDRAAMAILDYLPAAGPEEGSRWYERHLTPIINKNDEVEFVIEAVRDITDQRLLEQEKMERVKLEGVIEMAGTAAHELNSPLFAALGTAQLLRDDLTSEDMIEDMDMIIRNMKIMGELTRKMTDVTGFESAEYVGETRIVKLRSGKNYE